MYVYKPVKEYHDSKRNRINTYTWGHAVKVGTTAQAIIAKCSTYIRNCQFGSVALRNLRWKRLANVRANGNFFSGLEKLHELTFDVDMADTELHSNLQMITWIGMEDKVCSSLDSSQESRSFHCHLEVSVLFGQMGGTGMLHLLQISRMKIPASRPKKESSIAAHWLEGVMLVVTF